jgi:hypothetical protein
MMARSGSELAQQPGLLLISLDGLRIFKLAVSASKGVSCADEYGSTHRKLLRARNRSRDSGVPCKDPQRGAFSGLAKALPSEPQTRVRSTQTPRPEAVAARWARSGRRTRVAARPCSWP